MARGDAREGKWRGTWRMEWVANILHTTSEHGVSSITTADAHTSTASSRLNWRPRQLKWTPPFRQKMKCGFCACTITFKKQSNYSSGVTEYCGVKLEVLSHCITRAGVSHHSIPMDPQTGGKACLFFRFILGWFIAHCWYCWWSLNFGGRLENITDLAHKYRASSFLKKKLSSQIVNVAL